MLYSRTARVPHVSVYFISKTAQRLLIHHVTRPQEGECPLREAVEQVDGYHGPQGPPGGQRGAPPSPPASPGARRRQQQQQQLHPPLFVLVGGAVLVSVDLLDGPEEPLAVLAEPGECFGELCAAWPGLTHGRAATVTAVGPVDPAANPAARCVRARWGGTVPAKRAASPQHTHTHTHTHTRARARAAGFRGRGPERGLSPDGPGARRAPASRLPSPRSPRRSGSAGRGTEHHHGDGGGGGGGGCTVVRLQGPRTRQVLQGHCGAELATRCVVPDCNSGHQLVRVGWGWCP